MPWAIDDVDRFKKGLTDKQKRQWLAIANDVLARCQKAGGQGCEAAAIKQANGAVQQEADMTKIQEAITIKAQAKAMLRMAREFMANKTLPKSLHAALDEVQTQLKRNWADLELEAAEDEPEEETTEEAAVTRREDGEDFTASAFRGACPHCGYGKPGELKESDKCPFCWN